jgi:alpha-ketoglutarate-dependent taurine dioxygenase
MTEAERRTSEAAAPVIMAEEIGGPIAWRRRDIDPDAWRVPLPPACLAELDAIARTVRDEAPAITSLTPASFELPACRAVMALIRDRLTDGHGVAVLDRVPVEQYGTDASQAIGWLVAQLMGQVVAQKWDGTRLYEVRDRGVAPGQGVRRSITNLEQRFHTDGGWLTFAPALIGLFCLQPATEGGLSRCASLVSAHDQLRHDQELLGRLYRPFWWDRQNEHPAGEPPCSRHAVYRYDARTLSARYYDDYVRKGHSLAGESLDRAGAAALDALHAILDAEDSWIEFRLERGQFQYVNNRLVAHSRTAFRDDDRNGGRHLLRFWNRDEGPPDLEGGGARSATR